MVTVIIPTYNNKQALLFSVGSILRQTNSDFEVIIVDDGSVDGTPEFVKENFSDPRIVFIRLDKNSGVHEARNAGIRASKGEFLCFLDNDDELFDFALEKTLPIMLSNTKLGLVSAPFKVNNTDELTGFNYNNDQIIPYADLLCSNNVRRYKTGFVLIRKSFLEGIEFTMQNLDFIFYRKLAKKCKMYYHAKPLGIYTVGNDNSLTKKRKIPNPEMSKKRARALADFLDEFGSDIINFCPNRYSSYAYGASVGLILDKQKKKARGYLANSLNSSKNKKNLYLYYLTFFPVADKIMNLLFFIKKSQWKLPK